MESRRLKKAVGKVIAYNRACNGFQGLYSALLGGALAAQARRADLQANSRLAAGKQPKSDPTSVMRAGSKWMVVKSEYTSGQTLGSAIRHHKMR